MSAASSDTNGDRVDDAPGEDACMAHKIVAGHAVDPATWQDVTRFRKAERARLYALRRAASVTELQALSQDIGDGLDVLLGSLGGRKVAVYWPIRGEPDLRGWMARCHEAGAEILLPVVTQKDAPLIFRRWVPGSVMERGLWNIPVPADGDAQTPEIVISPLLGLDEAGFRLGNGGGYYDRTLAALEAMPMVIGVGAPNCRIRTIFPMPWDIPMTCAVLGRDAAQSFSPPR